MRKWASLLLVWAACGKGGTGTAQLPAYLAGDTCHDHGDSASCTADTGCTWYALGIACPVGQPCPGGVCQAKDPCTAHGDEKSCDAYAGCMWAGAIVGLCPPGASCPEGGGFCTHRSGDGCACACPLACPAGADCPPCACDCSGGDGGGGGTCACACAPCPPGATCPPCDCDCEPPPPTCGSGSTCTCTCPACAPGATCPPCACTCDGVPVPDPQASPCHQIPDEPSCRADKADGCVWGCPPCPLCPEGADCPPCGCSCEAPFMCSAGTTTP